MKPQAIEYFVFLDKSLLPLFKWSQNNNNNNNNNNDNNNDNNKK